MQPRNLTTDELTACKIILNKHDHGDIKVSPIHLQILTTNVALTELGQQVPLHLINEMNTAFKLHM